MLDLKFSPFPILSTERLVLRKISYDDAKDFFPLRSDSNVMQYINRPLAHSIDDAHQLIKVIDDLLNNNDGITWAISLKNNPVLIGTIGYWNIIKQHHRAEIGYLLAPSLQGKGIMHEALSTVLAYGFETMKLHSVEANVNPLNLASIKLLEKNSFIKEGYFKENYYYDGQFLDSAVYSLLTTKY